MKLKVIEIILLGFLITNCGTGGNSNSTLKEVVELPKYSVYSEEVYDTPIKTQITLHVIIEEDKINEELVRNLLNNLYSKSMKQTGFDYRTNPSSAYIYIYTSKEKAQSGMGQWIGMISKSHADTQSSIRISDTQMNSLNEVEENKWGLTYEQRQEVWTELIKSEDRAQKEAEKKYPLDKPGLTLDDLKKNGSLSNELNEKYDKAIATKYGLKMEILDSVSLEGIMNGWAFPEYE